MPLASTARKIEISINWFLSAIAINRNKEEFGWSRLLSRPGLYYNVQLWTRNSKSLFSIAIRSLPHVRNIALLLGLGRAKYTGHEIGTGLGEYTLSLPHSSVRTTNCAGRDHRRAFSWQHPWHESSWRHRMCWSLWTIVWESCTPSRSVPLSITSSDYTVLSFLVFGDIQLFEALCYCQACRDMKSKWREEQMMRKTLKEKITFDTST